MLTGVLFWRRDVRFSPLALSWNLELFVKNFDS